MKRNPHLAKLQPGYLFPEVRRRTDELLREKPEAKLISLGVGDTTQPIPEYIVKRMQKYVQKLGTVEGFSGYGLEEGNPPLRQRIAERLYDNKFAADEIFISDGANCDITRLQFLFGSDATLAVQDPAYPAYVDSGVITGQTGPYSEKTHGYEKLVYLPCSIENDFFPDFKKTPRTDLIYLCVPNNPTGAAATTQHLQELVDFAQANRSIIIYDAAYAAYIRDPLLPRSIYDIPGAEKVAIEVGSFSKMAGFTGVRLGWSVVPHALRFDDGSSVNKDWLRIIRSLFNGASNISQEGGMACLDPEGWEGLQRNIDYYMDNAHRLHSCLQELGIKSYGGTNAPFVWAYFPGKNSWDIFSDLLHRAHLITMPGSGFGPAGEGFLRLSAFGQRPQIEEAVQRLQHAFKDYR
jgi:LL-diaminopimelate aminotransferase